MTRNTTAARMAKIQKRLERLNPNVDVASYLDRELEPEEAEQAIATRHHLRTSDKIEGIGMKDFRSSMSEQYGIDNSRLQSMVAMTDPPMTELEMGQLSYAVNGRSYRSLMVDRGKKAKPARDARDYANHPDRRDVPTYDSKPKGPTKSHLKKHNRKEWKRRVDEDKRRFGGGLF